LSSSYLSFHNEIEFLKRFFTNNKYPVSLFENNLARFLTNVYDVPAQPISSVAKRVYYLKFKFYGYHSFRFRKDLQSILKSCFPHIEFKVLFYNSFTIGSFFSLKERIPDDLVSNVVYKFDCSGCNARYIGSTTRSFRMRKLEHMGRSIRTGLPMAKPEFSAIRNHSEDADHRLFHDNFSIIHRARDNYSLHVAESILIKTQKPSLNINGSAVPLFSVR